MNLKEEFSKMQSEDIYSLLLFVVYKMTEIPQYSTLSELVYVLDKGNFLKLCEYFGGMTIKIPTIEDLIVLVKSLTLYQLVNIEGEDYDKSVLSLGCGKDDLIEVEAAYIHICQVLNEYEFSVR